MSQDASLPAFNRFPVRLTEDVRDIATRAKKLPPMLLWVDPNVNDTNARIERAINCVTHLRRDGESTTLLRCKADKSRTPDVWTRPTYCLEANENVTLLRLNDPEEQDFAFIRTATGVEGFVMAIHLATTKTKATTITRVASTNEALQAIQGDLKPYVSLPPSRFRVMTNNVRVENGERNFNAGSDMARAMRAKVRSFSSSFPFSVPMFTLFSRDTVARSSCFALILSVQQAKWHMKRTCSSPMMRKLL
jgi:hypothetical protein